MVSAKRAPNSVKATTQPAAVNVHMAKTPEFVHLHCHSEYSLLDGVASIDGLVRRAQFLGQKALAITDHGNLHGAYKFYQRCRQTNESEGGPPVKAIIGLEAYLTPGTSRFDQTKVLWGHPDQKSDDVSNQGLYTHLTLWAENNQGLANLLELSSRSYLEGLSGKYPRVDRELLAELNGGLVASSGCPSGEVQTRLRLGQFDEALAAAKEMQDIFGADNYYIELMDHQLPIEKRCFRQLLEIAKTIHAPLLATNDSHYVEAEDAHTQEAMLALNSGSTLVESTIEKGGSRLAFSGSGYYLKSSQEMADLFAETPEAISNTVVLAERCNVEFPVGQDYMPRIEVPEGFTQESFLEGQVQAGLEKIYGQEVPEHLRERAQYELSVILPKGFASYFLVIADFVAWAKSNGIYVGPGRGSAAGSLVSYALGITELDPLQYGLIFERFLTAARTELPDIDIDFEKTQRDRVIDYIRNKYGEQYICQVVTFSTEKPAVSLRDAARILGYEYAVGDNLSKSYPDPARGVSMGFKELTNSKHPRFKEGETFRQLVLSDEKYQNAFDLATRLEGLTRGTSLHASAVIMSNTPVARVAPIMRDVDGRIFTQFDYYDCGDLGLVKMDFLGLITLDLFHFATNMIRHNANPDFDIGKIPLDDPKTFDLLRSGLTIGCFQIESGYIRDLLKTMQPDSLNDLIALNALNRPGPIATRSHLNYAYRKIGQQKITPLDPEIDPAIKEILQETYGLIVYQEQVMQISQALAGYSLADADKLRSVMGKKKVKEMSYQKAKMKKGMLANGYSERAFNVLWHSLESFAEYAFNKAHSAGYGLISYRTAYLKANYPNEFFAALLNTELNNKDKTALYLLEAKNFGVKIAQPDVNQSGLYYLATGDGVIFGLTGIRNVGEKFVEMIVSERELNGPYQSFDDFINRVPSQVLNKKIIESLIKAGAFDSIHANRKAIYISQGDKIEQALSVKHKQEQEGQLDLFVTSESDYSFLNSAPIPAVKDWSKDLRLQYEQEMLGFYLSDHPLSQLSDLLNQLSTSSIASLQNLEAPVADQTAAELAPNAKVAKAHLSNSGGKIDVTLAGLVTNFERRTSKRGNAYANFTLEDLSGSVQCSLFGNAFHTYNQVLYDNVIAQVFARYEPGAEGRTSSIVVNEVKIVDALAKERYAQFFEDSSDGGADAALISQRIESETMQNPHSSSPSELSDERSDQHSDERSLVIKVTLDDCFPDLLERLKVALLQHTGVQPVILKLDDGVSGIKRFQLGDQYRVTDNPSLRNQIYNLLKVRIAKVEHSIWEDNSLTRNSF